MTDPDSQSVLSPLSRAAMFLTLTVRSGGEDAVRDGLAGVDALRKSVGFRAVGEELSCVLGVGSNCWDRLYGSPRPAGLHPFRAVQGPKHTAPSTPGDLFLHLRAPRPDLCFELATLITESLRPHVDVVDEVHGFRSFDERDLLGFVDGTANPEGEEARSSVLVGDEDPRFAGGSYLVVQRYEHDLDAWNGRTVEAQQDAIGRTKLADVELSDDVKPPDSHVALTTVYDGDEQRQIVRFNMPFGRVGAREFGTYFAGYARDPQVIETMLDQMFTGTADAAHDRILDVSTARTGCLFFVPTATFVADPPTPRQAAATG